MASATGVEQWQGLGSAVGRAVERYSSDCLRTYEVDARRIVEDVGLETGNVEGGYARRQLYELIQNGADELIESRGRIQVVLTDESFYCANEGRAVSVEGVGALLGSHNSPKTGVEIGRFGLGFKSVLGVSTTPAVYSRSGSFRFDRTENLDLVRRIRPQTERVATLRIARPVDPIAAAEADPVLAELMGWATTVIALPRDVAGTDWLSDSMKKFPAQFLLFSAHVSRLVLDDRTAQGGRRCMELERDADVWHLDEEGDDSARTSWRVFETLHHPSPSVRDDGGEMARREVVPVSWAVPLNRPLPGALWAFFPTLETTTLSGVLNAPWKLTQDRTRLVEGPFNEELLRAVVGLVTENLERVNRSDDPGYVLELLPGRGRELRGWADEILSDAVYEQASNTRAVPDQKGVLQPPAALRIQPEGVPLDATEAWSQQATRPVGWVHASAVRSNTRRSRAERLLQAAGVLPSETHEWLEALAPSTRNARGSCSAIKVAAALVHSDLDRDMRSASIVLTRDGQMLPPRRGIVYLPAALNVDVDVDVRIVHHDVVEDAEALEALKILGLLEVSAVTVLDALVERAVGDPDVNHASSWRAIWDLARRVPEADLKNILITKHGLAASEVYVKTLGDWWGPLSTVLLPGDLLSPEDFKTSHRSLLVDVEFHRREVTVLRQLGATDRPVAGGGSLDEPWLKHYGRGLIEEAIEVAREHGARVKAEHFELVPAGPWGGPATPLDGLAEEPAARYARELLAVTQELGRWSLRRNKGSLVESEVEHPLIWRVRQLGWLPTQKGLRRIEDCVTPFLKELRDLLPVADLPRPASRAFGLPDTIDELDRHRVELALEAVERLDRDDAIGAAYLSLLPVAPEPPERIWAIVRREPTSVAPGQVCAAVSVKDLKVLRGTGTPFVRLPDEQSAERLVGAWGLKSVGDAVTSKIVSVPDGDREPVGDAYPLLRPIFDSRVDDLELLPCRELSREMYTEQGSITEELEFEIRDGLVYHLTSLSEVDRLRRLSERLGKPLERAEIQQVIENAQVEEARALLKRVRGLEDEAEKLLELIGVDALRSRIPQELIDAVEETDGHLDDLQAAALALNVFGVETLKEYRDVLVERGIQPPTQWSGRRPAIRFVTEELGFPRKYAGFAEGRLEQTLDVAGPSPLPDLHPFQRRSAHAIRQLIARERGRRGLLSLPTGAGKTRVAVQALVESMTVDSLTSPILWIAQTEELCEQAVQSWAEVWRAAGPDRGLRISRLWGGHSADAREDDGDQVVVATIDKIVDRCVDDDRYEWLAEAGCVVVDEAHTSIAKSYSTLLRWTGMDRRDDHAPLIGLSATPFRGVSKEETERLVGRYGRTRLDDDAFEEEISIPLLQREGILARVEHRVLEGSDVALSSAEKAEVEQMRQLPASVRNRIGADLDRTNRLVDSIMSLDAEWPVLLFAASVAHAETVAALVARRGRSAAAVSGNTPTAVRRHLVSEFREGRLRTLTNYGVLTQGFDAPSIRALYIARPTYSPNLYQQMIGRGLRGPRNGGKEECLVVDVADNVLAYGFDLAFMEFEYLWRT